MAEQVKIPEDKDLTPAMKQFKAAKIKYPDCIIFFRMGDFYELFYNDAILASKELNITLTKRGTKAKIPLAGIPYHAIDTYLPRLVKKGYKAAICEQTEDPKLAKGIVKRDVIRIVSPGTLMTDTQLVDRANNFIMAIYKEKDNYGISICDLSTGELKTTIINKENLMSEIEKYSPSEIVIPYNLKLNLPNNLFINQSHNFNYKNSYQILTSHFDVVSLQSYGIEEYDECIISTGALLGYLKETQMTSLGHISSILFYTTKDYMILDKTTIRNLELTANIKDNTRKYTLLDTIDRTTTAMGSRLLYQWILRPMIKKEDIKKRYDAVYQLLNTPFLKEELKDILKGFSDIERLISKINYKSANARDIISLKNSLKLLPFLKQAIEKIDAGIFEEYFDDIPLQELAEIIKKSIKPEPPLTVREGGIINPEFNDELEKLHDICSNGKKYILELEQKEKKKTNIPSLKVGFNKVFGYFIEITNKHKDKVPLNYIRKQTRVNSERYITEELKELESKILGAVEKINELEYNLFLKILEKINTKTVEIQKAAKQIGVLDTLLSFALVSADNNYIRPKITDNFDINIIDGRHPVIEVNTQYVPNNCNFSNDTVMKIITGPNMSGKSSYMRQNALIVLLAQIGCFVPAKSAEIGICDKIFTRVGAHDDLTSGQSTFMVEMSETANILNNATNKSLIILDEIGRGTSTFDGVSIAWSVAEYIYKRIKAKTLFATHYHVMTKLAKNPGIKNYSIAVKERNDEIIFLRKLIENATNKSFGIQVAKLAGLPKEVIIRAKEIMADLESQDNMKRTVKDKSDKSEMQMNLTDM